MSEAQALSAASEERVAVASNWTLVWWRFRRHYLALASAVLLACLYLVVLCPDFFSTQSPELTDARQAFIPVQPLHFFDGGRFSPWVPGISGKRNPDGMGARPKPQDAGAILRTGRALSGARPVRDERASARAGRCRPAHLPARLRPAGTRPVVTHHARHPNLDDAARADQRHGAPPTGSV